MASIKRGAGLRSMTETALTGAKYLVLTEHWLREECALSWRMYQNTCAIHHRKIQLPHRASCARSGRIRCSLPGQQIGGTEQASQPHLMPGQRCCCCVLEPREVRQAAVASLAGLQSASNVRELRDRSRQAPAAARNSWPGMPCLEGGGGGGGWG